MKRFAFLGSGPSALYTCKYVLDKSKDVLIDIIEKLPVPFGLVRYGVAPDHQEVKAVTSQFIDLINENNKRVRFFGNVSVDKDVTFDALKSAYDGVVVCTGAQNGLKLGLPNESIRGVFTAHDFVNWYNRYPESSDLENQFDFSKVRHVVIIGNGNVALDCARILSKSDAELEKSDISLDALRKIRQAPLESISIVGRRGPVQAAFTIKELRELTRLERARVHIDATDMDRGTGPASMAEVAINKPKQRILDLMRQCVSDPASHQTPTKPGLAIPMKFLRSPVSINGQGVIESVTFEVNELCGPPGSQKALGTGSLETVPCDLLLEALGYSATAIKGLPFDSRKGVFPSSEGRVVGSDGRPIGMCYVTGWAKRGSVGIIGSNIIDAKETAAAILMDVAQSAEPGKTADPAQLIPALRSPSVVTWERFLKIEEEELRRGRTLGRPRDKILTVSEMLEVASR